MVPGFKAKAIKPTKTVGQRLQAMRKKKQLSLEEAERLTKVKLKYLKALEEDRHDLLPTEVYSLGFLRCYAEVLGLKPKKLLEQYQVERQAIDRARIQQGVSLAPARRITGPHFLITPKTLLTLGSIVLVFGLVAYIVSGVRSFLAPPSLAINKPAPDSRIVSDKLIVEGETDPAVSLAINGELVTVDPSGHFSREIAVIPGLNMLEFVAINRIGKETKAIRKILADYEASPSPVPALTPTPVMTPTPSPVSSVSPTPSVNVSPTP